MGICLDTEQSAEASSQNFEEDTTRWAQPSPNNPQGTKTDNRKTPIINFALQNDAKLHFEVPKVPVIFVLGGPGSGKVTHCDNLMLEQKGVIHINMTDLLQQYAIGNDMQDFANLSSTTVAQVLMLEMKMSPSAKTYLISGYPRNMRDVVEYADNIQMVNGVILISWREKILEKQIEYGAKLGQVILHLARMELKNFFRNVVPVVDYFDQHHQLITVNGERHPDDVYKDFKQAVFKILGEQRHPPEFTTNGTIPTINMTSDIIDVANTTDDREPGSVPVLWVFGGPGSNKAELCAGSCQETGWRHISAGQLLRRLVATPTATSNRYDLSAHDVGVVRECISGGELVPTPLVMKVVQRHLEECLKMGVAGILLDGYPRDVPQAAEFEARWLQKPTLILLDCSKLQLGRGQLDDSVAAFRRRLELFRTSSLPLLKSLDADGRLTVVDGDTETATVQDDFKAVVRDHIRHLTDKSTTDHLHRQNDEDSGLLAN